MRAEVVFTTLRWGLAIGLLFVGRADRALAAPGPGDLSLRLARVVVPPAALEPGGVAYSPRTGMFYFLDGRLPVVQGMTAFRDTVGEWSFAAPLAGLNLTVQRDRLFVLDAATQALYVVPESEGGELDPRAMKRSPSPRSGPLRAEGLASDPASGALFVLDRLTRRIARFVPVETDARPSVTWLALPDLRSVTLRGLAFHPGSRHLWVMSPERARLYERGEDGHAIRAFDLSHLMLENPRGMVFAPSSDRTDEPSAMNLFVVDARQRGDQVHVRLVEIAFDTRVRARPAPATTAALELVRTTDMSRFSPPSPDPSGIAFDSASRKLWIVDGEVEETERWDHRNEFETRLSGAFDRGADLTSFTVEPTGIALDPTAGMAYLSDDDARKVFSVDLGGDGRLGTSDDRVVSFDTKDFDSNDPEGIAFDPIARRIFIADGVNAEVYEVMPGSDGVFDGDSRLVGHFDTKRLDVIDPETVEFNALVGTLFLIDRDGRRVVEVTTGGDEVASFDASNVHFDKPAGLAYGPGSANPAFMSFYIVDRGVDNDNHPSENDGKLYELASGISASAPAPAPALAIAIPIARGADDAEESSGGSMSLSSSDLELVEDGSAQTVGLRFDGVPIPPGSRIASAYVQFQVDETRSGSISLAIAGEATDDARTFRSSSRDLSSRAKTSAAVAWSPASWSRTGDAGPDQRTPDLSRVIEEIVARPGWRSGNALALILTGRGKRTAESYEGSRSGAATLHVEVASEPRNQAPVVDAGLDLEVTLPARAVLDGTVSDDRPAASLTVLWEKSSGPGWVDFANEHNPDTEASFEIAGSYVLRLTAEDGDLSASDEVTVVVRAPQAPPPPGSVFERRIANGLQDVEERSTGKMSLTSSDMELVEDGGAQTVGLRFTDVDLPPGAHIARAYVQFQVDEPKSGTTHLVIRGERNANAQVFTGSTHDVSSRPMTSASVAWSPAPWESVGEAGPGQRTPDLSAILEEILAQSGWRNGNALVLVVTGDGRRTAEAYEGDPNGAALLHVELEEAPPVEPTVVHLERTIEASSDDAEESLSGRMTLTSGDLDLTEGGSIHTIGLHFRDVRIPPGAHIVSAHLQFQADETEATETHLIIQAQADDDPPTFGLAIGDVTARPRTEEAVVWSPPAWVRGEAGEGQRTPDLAALLQAIVSRPGWQSGNALAWIISGRGHRSAESFEGDIGGAPRLVVAYE